MRATVRTPAGGSTVRTPLIGAGQIANILAAIAVALRFHVPLDEMVRVAGGFSPPPRRGEVVRLSGGVTVVDDSYNSSPVALERALRSLGRDRGHRRRVAVLGEMLELVPARPPCIAPAGDSRSRPGSTCWWSSGERRRCRWRKAPVRQASPPAAS